MITGEIKRFLRDDGLLKVSRTIKEDGLKVRLARQRLQSRLHREPTLQELSEEAQLSQEDVILAMEAGAEVESSIAAAGRRTAASCVWRTGWWPRPRLWSQHGKQRCGGK